MAHVTQAVMVVALALGTGATTVAVVNEDIPDMAVPDMAWEQSGALDGRSFDILAQVGDNETLETDRLVFSEQGFMSLDCQLYCDFGYSDYQTMQEGDVVHFTATTRCPTAPHTVVWVGTVTGDEIDVKASWTTRRWYWTHQIMAIGSGAQIPEGAEDYTPGVTG